MRTIRHISLLLVLLCVPAFAAFGQRTMKGQYFVDVSGGWIPTATVGTGMYTLSGYWCAGIDGLLMRRKLASGGAVLDTRLDVYHLRARGGYMYRFVGSRSRAVSLYGGGEAWVGLESVDPFRALPDDIVISIEGNSFVVGVTPRLEAEFYVGRNVALTLGGRLPLAFLSRMRLLTAQGTAGVRVAF